MKIKQRVPSQIFQRLLVVNDCVPRSSAMNMAVDEALLESAKVPSIRFYRWSSPALSFGYFGKFADVADYAKQGDLVRRWTGGGIVFHGEDLTYSIAIPVSDPVFSEPTRWIYEKIHCALRDALVGCGQQAVVAVIGDSENYSRADRSTGINDAGGNGFCFAKPVYADVLVNGLKVAGAAQRRTRTGLLQQGSIQLATGPVRVPKAFGTRYADLGEEIAARFARELSRNCAERKIDNETLNRAREIATWKYGTQEWLRRR